VVKVEPGQVADLSALEVRLLDGLGEQVDSATHGYEEGASALVGPDWRLRRGRLVTLSGTVEHAEAVLGRMRSQVVPRTDGRERVSLVAIEGLLGVEREPHLWWRFYNGDTEPIPVDTVRRSMGLWVGERRLPLTTPYNGPALLPPGRAMTGLWYLADAYPVTGNVRVRLEALRYFSDEVVLSQS